MDFRGRSFYLAIARKAVADVGEILSAHLRSRLPQGAGPSREREVGAPARQEVHPSIASKAEKQSAPEWTETQRRILEELDSLAMTAEALTKRLQDIGVERDLRTVKAALRDLKMADAVRNKRGLGYYRPDKPPKLAERLTTP